MHLAVALDGYGWHPQAWRYALSRNTSHSAHLTGSYWAAQVAEAERGLLDFVTFEDTLQAQQGRRERISPRRLAGRADAVQVAARVAPTTRHVGLVPVATVTHTEPFHVSKSIATLDFVSHGRAGWQARVSGAAHEAALFGRRTELDGEELFTEAADFVEVVRRLWDSWEDDAVIRDVATGRYVDRDKLHYVDFVGKYFAVKGPSITPRPPQGQPVITALAHAPRVYEFAAQSADVVFITPQDDASLRRILDEVEHARGQPKVYADVLVSLAADPIVPAEDIHSDALVFTGDATEFAELLHRWHDLGVDGFRLRPACNQLDLSAIVGDLVPLLQRAGQFRSEYRAGETLRERLGLPKALNRYVGQA
jgi:alkanesulfonate monooxygenase SsuD/methylene tetrahydromethanopterin reductase-like flavin-dependent oxidoreductase (luciferase family)